MPVERCTTCGNPTVPHPYRHPITRRQQPPRPMTGTTPIPEESTVSTPAPSTVIINNPSQEIPPSVREALIHHLDGAERGIEYHREQQQQFQAKADEHKAQGEAAARRAQELRAYLAGGENVAPSSVAVARAQERFDTVMREPMSTELDRREVAEELAAAQRASA